MRVRMKVAISGTRDGLPWPAIGDEIDLPDTHAAKLCASGQAEPVPVDVVETAVAPKAETRPSRGAAKKAATKRTTARQR